MIQRCQTGEYIMHRNLLFDLDQTLLDFHTSEHIALKAIMERERQVFTEERYDLFKQINKLLWLEFEKGRITKNDLFATRFRLLFKDCGYEAEESELLSINSDFIDSMSQNGVIMDGADRFLKRITENMSDLRIYVITNGAEKNAIGRIASTGLNDYICEAFISDTMGTAKPSREFFDIVKAAVGEPDESCLVIGDSLTSDMLGAKNAGLTSCWFMPEGNVKEAVKEYDINYTASSFEELYDIILNWSSALHELK